MQYCFNGMINNFIFISDSTYDDSFILKSSFLSITPIHLIDTDENNNMFETQTRYRSFTPNEMHLRKKNYLATSVVIVASSNTIIAKMMNDMKNSVWWNHEALFLVVNEDAEKSCHMARSFLNAVWTSNILSAIYVCNNCNNQPMLYTFNPYTSLAPKFWDKVRDDHSSDKYWTLFQHQFDFSQSFELHYDKIVIDLPFWFVSLIEHNQVFDVTFSR